MKLSKTLPLVLLGVLVATLMFLAPRLGADSGPPSGILSRHEPATTIDTSSGLLPRGTVVEPIVIEQPADDGKPSSSAGLTVEFSITEPTQAEIQAVPELTAEELKAAGLDTP